MKSGLTLLGLVGLTAGCDPTYSVGKWACGDAPHTDAGVDAGASPVAVPWRTGFEDGFCGYADVGGYCYADELASHGVLVTSPVRSGKYAAAFSVDSAVPDTGALQARCVRGGQLPTAAYYGAWYLVPAVHTNGDNWNLFHFQGGQAGGTFHGLWDVSLVNEPGGGLNLAVFNFLDGTLSPASSAPPIPIGSWFHIETYFERASDATGELTVRQDGVVAYRFQDVVTDDSEVGEWYVGNLANVLTPSRVTVYVDDVEIREAP